MGSKTGFFTKLFKSTYDFEYYKNFIGETTGKAVTYLLLLSILFGTISFIRPIYSYNNGIAEVIDTFAKKVPDFIFENGQLDVKSNAPIVFEEKNGVIIIDTTGKTDASALNNYSEGMLVLRDKFIQKRAVETKTVEFSSFKGFTLTKDKVQGWIPYLKWFSIFIIFFGMIYFFISKLFSILFISIFGAIFNNAKRTGLQYSQIFSLSIYALTLSIIIKVASGAANMPIPFFWLIYHGIGVLYLWKAISTITAFRSLELQTPEVQVTEEELG